MKPSLPSSYDPNHLFDYLHSLLKLKNDAALARKLEVAPPVISKVRHFRIPLSAALIIRIHEVTGISISDIKMLTGDRRRKQRMS